MVLVTQLYTSNIMKSIITIFILFINTYIFSQNIDKIKKADTIYIYFKEDKNFQIYSKSSLTTKLHETYFFNSIDKSWIYIQFIHQSLYYGEEKKIKKSFLKKNKDLIISYDFLSKFNPIEATDLIGHKKKVYLIDDKDICWFTLKLKEVKVVGTYKINEE